MVSGHIFTALERFLSWWRDREIVRDAVNSAGAKTLEGPSHSAQKFQREAITVQVTGTGTWGKVAFWKITLYSQALDIFG